MRMRVIGTALIGWLFIFSVAEGVEIRYDKADHRDPFIPQTGAYGGLDDSTGSDGLSVEGIVFDPKGSSYALIRDQIYREGENVGGAQLVKILPDRVIFSQQSQEVVIWLREEVVEQKGHEATQKKSVQ